MTVNQDELRAKFDNLDQLLDAAKAAFDYHTQDEFISALQQIESKLGELRTSVVGETPSPEDAPTDQE